MSGRHAFAAVALVAILTAAAASQQDQGGGADTYPVPSSGGLEDLVVSSAAGFDLQSSERLPNLIALGALDALGLKYTAPDGSLIYLVMAALSDASTAETELANAVAGFQSDGLSIISDKDYLDTQGNRLGRAVVLRNGSEAVTWTNGSLLFGLGGPHDRAGEFANALPY